MFINNKMILDTTEKILNRKQSFTNLFHPTTVILLLILDWGGFILEIPQIISPFTLIVTFIGIFILTSILAYFLQRHFAGENKRTAILKGILAGLICAIPTGIMSSVIGSMILILSGGKALGNDGANGLLKMFEKV